MVEEYRDQLRKYNALLGQRNVPAIVLDATRPSPYYDQEYVEELIPLLDATRAERDDFRHLYWYPRPARSQNHGIFDAFNNNIEIYHQKSDPYKHLLDTWLHEGQHSKDREELGLFDFRDTVSDSIPYLRQPGELRAAGRVIGTAMRKKGARMPKDIFNLYDWIYNNMRPGHERNITKALYEDLVDKEDFAKDRYNIFLNMIIQAMDEGKLRDVWSDNKLKNVLIGNWPKAHLMSAVRGVV